MILISHVSRSILTYLNFYISYTKLNCCMFKFVCINSCLFQNQNCILYLEIGVYIGPLLCFNSHIPSLLSCYLVNYLPTYQQLSIICFTIGCVSISLYLCQTHIHLILPYKIHIIVFILLLNNTNAIYNNVAHYRFIFVLAEKYADICIILLLNHYRRG